MNLEINVINQMWSGSESGGGSKRVSWGGGRGDWGEGRIGKVMGRTWGSWGCGYERGWRDRMAKGEDGGRGGGWELDSGGRG